jgi:hypothetical protein
MKNLIASLCAVFAVAVLSGCESTDKSGGSSQVASPTNPTHIALLYHPPKADYIELGHVSTYKVQPDPGQTWQNSFQKQAGSLGADAVIVDTTTLNNINTPLVSGTAIRFKPKPAQ